MICVHFAWLFGVGGKPFACIVAEAMLKNALCKCFQNCFASFTWQNCTHFIVKFETMHLQALLKFFDISCVFAHFRGNNFEKQKKDCPFVAVQERHKTRQARMTPRSGAVRQKKDCPFVAVQEKRKTRQARMTPRSGAVRQKKDCPFVAVQEKTHSEASAHDATK